MPTPSETLADLHKAVLELNHRADLANKRLDAAEAVVVKLGIGIEVWLPRPFYAGYTLGVYKSPEGRWCLAVRCMATSEKAGEPDREVILPVSGGPRLVRIQAAKAVDELMELVLRTANEQLEEARR